MTDAPDKPASPACSLDEAPDSYRGYLTPAEIAVRAAAIAAALQRDGRRDLAERLRAAFPSLPTASAAAEDVAAAFETLLPRIADDRLHARLREIRASL